jgi:hypothetical protein
MATVGPQRELGNPPPWTQILDPPDLPIDSWLVNSGGICLEFFLWNLADFADSKPLRATVGPRRELGDLRPWARILDPADLPIDSWLVNLGGICIEFFVWNSSDFADLKPLMATVGPRRQLGDPHPWTQLWEPPDLPIDSWLENSGGIHIEFFVWHSADFANLKPLMATVGSRRELGDLHPWTQILDPSDLPSESWLVNLGGICIEFSMWNSADCADFKLIAATVISVFSLHRFETYVETHSTQMGNQCYARQYLWRSYVAAIKTTL